MTSRFLRCLFDLVLSGTEFPLDLQLIDRVEIVRGPSSSLYGTRAVFAVINVVTKTGKDLEGPLFSAGAGSLGTGIQWFAQIIKRSKLSPEGFFIDYSDQDHRNVAKFGVVLQHGERLPAVKTIHLNVQRNGQRPVSAGD